MNTAASGRPPGAFNFLPWREWHQAQRRRRQRLLWITGCVLAPLAGLWLQTHHYTENHSQLLAYEQLRASNHVRAMQLEELGRRQDAIADWLVATTLDRRTAQRWSALATLLSVEHSTPDPVVRKLSMSDGRLILHGQSSEVSDLKLLERQGDRLFAGEYALREVRKEHDLFHFQMDVAWTGSGTVPSLTGEISP